MKIKRPSKQFHRVRAAASRKWLGLAVAFCAAGCSLRLSANPTGMTVRLGTATAQTSGAQLNLTVSQTAFLNWSSFNIQAGETTTFIQPSANSVVLNEIGGANPSQIFGNLNANGTVILANANGFYFGPNSMIKVGGDFIATTAPITPDFGSGSSWTFTGMPPLASIINYGSIQAGNGRSLFLIAENIQNSGSLNAPDGNIGLAAGQTVLVSDRPDGRGLSASVQVPAGSVNNLGQITADAGTIALQAQVVNQNGIIQANSVQNQNGDIELIASDQLSLGANSHIIASGDISDSGSAGGNVKLKSGNTFSDRTGNQIVTTGGAHGGNGGNVEISAPNVLSLNSGIDALAQPGSTAGKLLLDPDYIILDTSGSGSAGSGTVLAGSNPGSTLDLNVNSAFASLAVSQIILQAAYDITLAGGTSWNLSGTIGANYGGVTSGQLTLEAGRNIIFGNGSKITDANNWSVTLDAGYSFANNAVQSGAGSIYLNNNSGGTTGGGWIQTAAGNINLIAGQDILLGSGSVSTTGGGSIFADAIADNINAGSFNGGTSFTATPTSDYRFIGAGAIPNPVLSGFSTEAGGNVTLIAGNNIASVPTLPNSSTWPGASGAYGAGNVTIIAGNQITGNYNLANGVGTLLAGVQVQSAQAGVLQNPNGNPAAYDSTLNALETEVTQTQNPGGNIGVASGASGPVTLSLIQGSWNAWAANNIYLKEVNNPNGTFNSSQSFLFNYAPDATANFWAGNAIELVGASLTRVSRQNQTMPPIYAPVLTLNAGAGGITIGNSIILYPSSEGSLTIITRDGGDLNGAVPANSTTLTGITMSDSGSANWTTFAAGHAATPLHLDDPNPVLLDVSGDINSFGLTVPTFAQINVVGDTYNFGFLGQNLSPSQTTSINVGQTAKQIMELAGLLNSATDSSLRVGGSITYRGDLTSEILSGAISSGAFDAIIVGDPALAGVLRYDATTGTISFVGVMGSATEQSLLNPTDSNGNAILTGAQLTAWQTAIAQLYAASQSASLGDNGLALSGPGNFNLNANSIDLGISGGISVLAPDSALAAISPYGANINVTTVGNLEMTSTKIANESYLGGINLNVGGTLDVGGEYTTFGDPGAPKGIFTTSGGNVTVTANGDVNVDGSRIAAYDGGNITVESLTGDVNAGNGGAGYVSMNALELDPLTGQLVSIPADIPGSGILATTVPGSLASLGNILVETPNGNISASQGGIIQISFNASDASQATAELLAGYELQDGQGNRVLAQNLASGTPALVLSDQNVVTLGSMIQVLPSGSSVPISLTQVLNAKGNPLLDAGGHPLYIETSDTSRRIVEYVQGSITPYLDAGGDPVNVAQPLEASGNSILVQGRNIDTSGSGVIAQKIIVKAIGGVGGLYVSLGSSPINIGANNFLPGPEGIGPVIYGSGKPVINTTDPNTGTEPTIISDTGSTAPPPTEVAKTDAPTADTATTVTTKTEDQDDGSGDEESKKKGKGIILAQKTGRVTVILPPKQQPKAQTLEPRT
jgi:filamentous hemagglutinin family protein